LYWSAGNYAGFGAGAHAHVDGTRWWNVRLPRDFIARVEAGDTTEGGRESLDPDARAGEALMLGLRLADGIDPSAFATRFADGALEARAPELDRLISLGLLVRSAGRIALTPRGTMLANEVATGLL
jgi:oxygen-independent coproporphyrinogen-3 oxidase